MNNNNRKKPTTGSFSRRKFINIASAAGLYSLIMKKGAASGTGDLCRLTNPVPAAINDGESNLIGAYGEWAAGQMDASLPSHSFRKDHWSNLDEWRQSARKITRERLAIPDLGSMPEVRINRQYTYGGLHIEELSWDLPYGRPAEALLLKPSGSRSPLPGIMAFHDHAANKYFGKRKITRTSESRHPVMESHQNNYYDGLAWANEIAKRGYVVLVSDAFPFASRRVMMEDVPVHLRGGLTDDDPENPSNISAYNEWAARHEHIMAKSLFSAGTTWPGVFFAEDKIALDILCARSDVDAEKIGCGGLSGGGMRTVFMTGLDTRIKCAVCVGFMTTWKDLVLYKSFTHTWMTYAPLLPNELDFPEILGLSVPTPVFVINASEDPLFTLEGMKDADAVLAEVYKKAEAQGKYKCSFYPGGHKFGSEMQADAFDWFDRWLK